MLRTRIRYDPNRPTRLESGEIGEQLPKVVMIAPLQLVLDNNRAAVFVFGDKVNAEGARRLLPLDAAELKAHSVGEDIDVLLQPRREVESFVTPHLTSG